MNRWILAFCFALFTPLLALAQDDVPVAFDLTYDQSVQETLTAAAFYDWWQFEGLAGDLIVVDMQASGGLAPLLGLLDPGGSLVARSENGVIDGTITLEYALPSPGRYTIVATRVDNENGTTIGAYSLQLRRANATSLDSTLYQDVTFVCEDFEATTAATIRLQDDLKEGQRYRVTVYGLDGFEPVIRIEFQGPKMVEPYEFCNTDAQVTTGDTYTLPGNITGTITADKRIQASQIGINGADQAGVVTLTIASREGKPGKWFAVIDQIGLDAGGDIDTIEVRLGPLAATRTALTAYIVGKSNSRLDPILRWGEQDSFCDDAGRGDCVEVPSIARYGATLNELGTPEPILGDRSDAGLILAPGNADPMTLVIGSRNNETHGDYALFLIGELPPRP
jgi:hypothetical protein